MRFPCCRRTGQVLQYRLCCHSIVVCVAVAAGLAVKCLCSAIAQPGSACLCSAIAQPASGTVPGVIIEQPAHCLTLRSLPGMKVLCWLVNNANTGRRGTTWGWLCSKCAGGSYALHLTRNCVPSDIRNACMMRKLPRGSLLSVLSTATDVPVFEIVGR